MAEHEALDEQYTTVTFFGACKPKFPARPADDRIQTGPFLDAARVILPFVDTLGKAFTLVKKDIAGNIEKIDRQFKKDPEKYKFINAIIEEDHEKKGKMTEGCVGVLWLKRGLDFICSMFRELLEDQKNCITDENLTPSVARAYDATLRQYHGWMTQKIIAGVLKLVPYRKDLFAKLMLDSSATTDMVLKDIELYNVNLSSNIALLSQLLLQHNCESQEKV